MKLRMAKASLRTAEATRLHTEIAQLFAQLQALGDPIRARFVTPLHRDYTTSIRRLADQHRRLVGGWGR